MCPGRFSDSPLNTYTRIIRALRRVSLCPCQQGSTVQNFNKYETNSYIAFATSLFAGKLMKQTFQKWMVRCIISKCNLTPGIPKECKLCVKHVCLRKDFFVYVEQSKSIYCHSNAQRILLGKAKDFEKKI